MGFMCRNFNNSYTWTGQAKPHGLPNAGSCVGISKFLHIKEAPETSRCTTGSSSREKTEGGLISGFNCLYPDLQVI